MKGCIFLQRSFARVGHAMAIVFKEKYGVDEFCGYVALRTSLGFLKRQKNVKYHRLLLDEDLHEQYKNEIIDYDYLRWLEEKYGLPNLWPYVLVDRIIMHGQLVREYPYDQPLYTHEDILKIIQDRT